MVQPARFDAASAEESRDRSLLRSFLWCIEQYGPVLGFDERGKAPGLPADRRCIPAPYPAGLGNFVIKIISSVRSAELTAIGLRSRPASVREIRGRRIEGSAGWLSTRSPGRFGDQREPGA